MLNDVLRHLERALGLIACLDRIVQARCIALCHQCRNLRGQLGELERACFHVSLCSLEAVRGLEQAALTRQNRNKRTSCSTRSSKAKHCSRGWATSRPINHNQWLISASCSADGSRVFVFRFLVDGERCHPDRSDAKDGGQSTCK